MKHRIKICALGLLALGVVAIPLTPFAASPHNGIQGRAVVVQPSASGPVMIPVQTSFTVTWLKNKIDRQIATVTTDGHGAFQLDLQPGLYVLLPAPVRYGSCTLSAGPIAVTVDKKQFTTVMIAYAACPNP